jgi:hypothetical protein
MVRIPVMTVLVVVVLTGLPVSSAHQTVDGRGGNDEGR